jgi:hypothetical protein
LLPGIHAGFEKSHDKTGERIEILRCIARQQARAAAGRRTVNSSKLGSSGRLKMMSAPAGPRVISGTATSLQASAAAHAEFVGGDGCGWDGATCQFVTDDRQLQAGERGIFFGSTQTARTTRKIAVAAVHRDACRRHATLSAPLDPALNSSDFVSTDFTSSPLHCSISAESRAEED